MEQLRNLIKWRRDWCYKNILQPVLTQRLISLLKTFYPLTERFLDLLAG